MNWWRKEYFILGFGIPRQVLVLLDALHGVELFPLYWKSVLVEFVLFIIEEDLLVELFTHEVHYQILDARKLVVFEGSIGVDGDFHLFLFRLLMLEFNGVDCLLPCIDPLNQFLRLRQVFLQDLDRVVGLRLLVNQTFQFLQTGQKHKRLNQIRHWLVLPD